LNNHNLWFETLYKRIGVPFWAGAVLLSLGPFISAELGAAYLSGATTLISLHRFLYLQLPEYTLAIVGAQSASLFVSRQMQNLSRQIGGFHTDLTLLYKGRYFAPFVAGTIFGNFLTPFPGYSGFQNFVTNIPWSYAILCVATFMWVLLVSAILIYREGASPLRPAHFAFDSMMGFRPFGAVISRITAVYFLFISSLFLVVGAYDSSLASLASEVSALGLIVAGSLVPVLATWRFHRKMQEVKRHRVDWVDRLYFRYIRRLEGATTGVGRRNLISCIGNLSLLREEIHGLDEWPFDTKFIIKLAAGVGFASGVAVITQFLLHP